MTVKRHIQLHNGKCLVTERTLTSDDAGKLCHVAWIDQKDPILAICEMAKAINNFPINCAVWTKAGEILSPESRDLIKKWRNNCPSPHPLSAPQPNLQNLKKSSGQLSRSSNKKVHPLFYPGCQLLKETSQKRMHQIFNALNPVSVGLDLRPLVQTLGYVDSHMDGGNDGKWRHSFRLIETWAGKDTIIFSNDDLQKGSSFCMDENDKNYDENLAYAKNGITAWAVPEGSLTLISNQSLNWQPIIHGSPFHSAKDGFLSRNQERIVAVYNVVLERL